MRLPTTPSKCYDSGNALELRYASNELERQCTGSRYMIRRLGKQRAASLRLRLNELRTAEGLEDLLFFPGKWEELKGNRSGQWSAGLTANWRLIVEPLVDTVAVIHILEITDYH